MRNHAFPLALTAALVAAPALAQDYARVPILGGGEAEWMISNWPAGQSSIAFWSADNVRRSGDFLEFVLSEGGDEERPYLGAEIQSPEVAETGVWKFEATAPRMQDGAVFGMFLYSADWRNDPWREYDFEFVGEDTTEVQLNIHFHVDGRHVSLDRKGRARKVVDLGFDAADGPHIYEIEVQDQRAIFRIDGKVVGDFGPDDMPGGVWSTGPLRSFVDLWAAPPEMADWTGSWRYAGEPLVGRVHGLAVPDGAVVDQ